MPSAAALPPISIPVPAVAGSSLLEADWGIVGLLFTIAGSFLLANAILFRHPRQMVEDHFGKRQRRLHPIRVYIFHRVQLRVGFLFLLLGFGLQIYGHTLPSSEGASEFPTAWAGVVVILAGLLLTTGWWWSFRLFRRYVLAHLVAHPVDFEADPRQAREVGDLFGVDASGVDTVQSYTRRLRERLGLPGPHRGGGAVRMPADEDTETELELSQPEV